MKKAIEMLRRMLAVLVVGSMLLAAVPSAMAEDLFGGLGSMFSGLLGGKTDDAAVDDEKPTDFYELMDYYEAFFDEYVEFMKDLDDDSLSDLGVLTRYTEFMTKYTQYLEELDEIDEEELSDKELAYYLEVNLRIQKKLLEAMD